VEQDLVDLALGIDGSDGLLQVSDVPEVEGLVLSAGSQILGVGRNGHSVDLSLVRLEGVPDLEVGVPDLESSVPAHRGEVGVEGALGLALQVRRVSDLADPVLMVVLLRGVPAVSKRVPQLDLLVGARRNDLSVVLREAHGVNLLLMADELAHSLPSLQVPKTQGLVP